MTIRVNIGVAGLGAAGWGMVAALQRHAGFAWLAAAEPDDAERARVKAEHGVEAYASFESLLKHPGLDAVYIATPTQLHAQQTIDAARAGKHVLVEKPMAPTLEAAREMVDTANRSGTVLLVGHSHSHDLPVRRMRELIESEELGAVRMVQNWYYSDWVARPRHATELDPTQGGGVTFRQGAHQFDILRLLCGGVARSVRARTFDWNPARPTIGAHSAWIDFGDAAATAVYNGYGHFATSELYGGIGEWGQAPATAPAARGAPGAIGGTGLSEALAKRERARTAIPAGAPHQPFFGLTLVSCERGDMRQSPQGLLLYTREGRREIPLPTDSSPRDLVLAEFHDAICGESQPVHDGAWGLATLEVCIAAQRSSLTGTEIALTEQVAAPPLARLP